jgi:tetratricopeptide (TPR) repeat protein
MRAGLRSRGNAIVTRSLDETSPFEKALAAVRRYADNWCVTGGQYWWAELPEDRAGLQRLVAEMERKIALLERPGIRDDTEKAFAHALATLELAEARMQLDDYREAEGLFERSANEFMGVGSVEGERHAGWARVNQARASAERGRVRAAVAIVDRMLDEQGGFPAFDEFPGGVWTPLCFWLRVLAREKSWKRLCEACDVALSILDPYGPRSEREGIAEALIHRAGAAEMLGRPGEALEFYEQAIPLLEDFRSDESALWLDLATTRVPELQVELSRHVDTTNAVHRIIAIFKKSKNG